MAELNGTSLVSDPNLKAYQRLEADGSATVGTALTLVGSPTFATGKYGNGMVLNGTTQYGTYPSGTGTFPYTNNWAVSMWFKNNSDTQWCFGGNTGGGGTTSITLEYGFNFAGKLAMFSYTGTQQNVSYTWTTDNNWHHIVFQQGSSIGMEIWLDGVRVANNAANTAAPADPSLTFGIGGRGTGDFLFNGMLDDVAIFDRPLTSTEIGTLAGGAAASTIKQLAALGAG